MSVPGGGPAPPALAAGGRKALARSLHRCRAARRSECHIPRLSSPAQSQAAAPQAEAPAATISDFYKQALAREQGIRNQRMANAAMRPFGLGSPPQRSRAALAARDAGVNPQMADMELRAKELELQRMESDMRRADKELEFQQQDRQAVAADRARQLQIEKAKMLADLGADPSIAYKEVLGMEGVSAYPSDYRIRSTGIETGQTPAQIDQAVRQVDAMRKIDEMSQSGNSDVSRLRGMAGTTLGPDATSYDRVSDFLERVAGTGYLGLADGVDVPVSGGAIVVGNESMGPTFVPEGQLMPPFETLMLFAEREGISPSDFSAYYKEASDEGWGFVPLSAQQKRINQYLRSNIFGEGVPLGQYLNSNVNGAGMPLTPAQRQVVPPEPATTEGPPARPRGFSWLNNATTEGSPARPRGFSWLNNQ